MNTIRSENSNSNDVADKFNALHFAPIAEVDQPTDVGGIRESKGYRTECIGSDTARRRSVPKRNRHCRRVAVGKLMPVSGADHSRRLTVSVAHATVERQRVCRKQGLLDVETGTVIRSATKSVSLRASHKCDLPLYAMAIASFVVCRAGKNRSIIVIKAQNRAVGCRAKYPLPFILVLVGKLTRRQEAYCLREGTQGYVDNGASPRTYDQILDERRQK